jgi:hypothetical protein
VGAELRAGDVGARLAEHLLAGGDDRPDGQHVGHRPGRREESGLVAEEVGHPLLEGGHRRVLAVHIVAHFCPRHRLSHRFGGPGDGVTAEVDHRVILAPVAP